jgi:hypothetical protein
MDAADIESITVLVFWVAGSLVVVVGAAAAGAAGKTV